jgi:N utilization substance protein B
MKGQKDDRHQARKLAFATTYCMLYENSDIQSCTELSVENLGLQENDWDQELTQTIIQGTIVNKEKIDAIIRECAPQWPLDKIFKIDLVILEIAVYELLFDGQVPEKVVIDEAIELAKEFGNETSSKFVNGVLGTVLENKEKYVPKEDTKDNS